MTTILTSEIESKVQKIHESSTVKGDFIEIGAGQPLSNLLFRFSGSSNTIISTFCPYHSDLQSQIYGRNGGSDRSVSISFRSVSISFVVKVIRYHLNLKSKHDIWISTFQLKSDGCSHGWIGYLNQHNRKLNIVHITLPNSFERNESIDYLGTASLDLLLLFSELSTDGQLYSNYIDFFESVEINSKNDLDFITLKNLQIPTLLKCKESYYVLNSKHNWERLEDNFRSNEPIVFFKGSFNPPHNGHWEMIDHILKIYPNSPLGLMISTKNYDSNKKDMNTDDIEYRLGLINEHFNQNTQLYKNCRTVFTHKGLFRENIEQLVERFPKQELIFMMGMDTLTRIEPSLFDYIKNIKRVKFIVFDRDRELMYIDRDEFPCCRFIRYDNPLRSRDLRANE